MKTKGWSLQPAPSPWSQDLLRIDRRHGCGCCLYYLGAMYVVAMAILALLVHVFDWKPFERTELKFSVKEWRAHERSWIRNDRRIEMAQDLVERSLLIGKDWETVINTLGNNYYV